MWYLPSHLALTYIYQLFAAAFTREQSWTFTVDLDFHRCEMPFRANASDWLQQMFVGKVW